MIQSLSLFLLLAVFFSLAGAAVLTYEIYTLAPGDTPENLALRHGLRPEEIISIDDGPWQPGKRVALLKRYSESPPQSSPQPAAQNGPRLASIISASEIRSQPGGGNFLFRPEVGSKVIVTTESPTHYGVMMADYSTGWIEKAALSLEAPIDSEWLQRVLSGARLEIVQESFRYLGLPYRYGGHLPYDTDCSLLVQRVFLSQGVNLPRTAAAQSQVGTPIALNELRPGDRLYFINSRGVINHTGIYIGAGRFIHASSNRGCVAVDNLANSYLRRLVSIRR